MQRFISIEFMMCTFFCVFQPGRCVGTAVFAVSASTSSLWTSERLVLAGFPTILLSVPLLHLYFLMFDIFLNYVIEWITGMSLFEFNYQSR